MKDIEIAEKNQEKAKDPHRKSPPREKIVKTGLDGNVVEKKDAEKYVNPEATDNPRTLELATDQSIAARNLLYNPNSSCLEVINHCADGITSVMEVLEPTDTDTPQEKIDKDEILVSMVTRLMADGGTGRIDGFNDRLKELVELEKKVPQPAEYGEKLHKLADECRENMAEITENARIPGPEGAVARQGIMSFMGDLGGLEQKETGYGGAYKGPLGAPGEDGKKSTASLRVYDAYVEGLFNHQRKLNGEHTNDLKEFREDFIKARAETSEKQSATEGGSLSASANAGGKKAERAVFADFKTEERTGLLNKGPEAEAQLKIENPQHKTTLLDAAWPKFVVSKELTQDVVEPVTGHVSGTFGEAAFTMNMFCGTDPKDATRESPGGAPHKEDQSEKAEKTRDRLVSVGALAAAGLITAGFHSAVEVWQPMSNLTTASTLKSMGTDAVEESKAHVEALKAFRDLEGEKPSEFQHEGYSLQESIMLDEDDLTARVDAMEIHATKEHDMISMLQGGGTLGTLEVSRAMANQSTNPDVPYKLYSVETQMEELEMLTGGSPYIEKVREIAKQKETPEQQFYLKTAIEKAYRVSFDVQAKQNVSDVMDVDDKSNRPERVKKHMDELAQRFGDTPYIERVREISQQAESPEQEIELKMALDEAYEFSFNNQMDKIHDVLNEGKEDMGVTVQTEMGQRFFDQSIKPIGESSFNKPAQLKEPKPEEAVQKARSTMEKFKSNIPREPKEEESLVINPNLS
jgi:hypothetical protein